MTGWIVLGVYVAGVFAAARLVYVFWADDPDDGRFYAVLAALIWPLALAIVAVLGLLSLPLLGAKTQAERRQAAAARRRGAEVKAQTAEWERQKRDARTAELEAENERLRAETAETDVTDGR